MNHSTSVQSRGDGHIELATDGVADQSIAWETEVLHEQYADWFLLHIHHRGAPKGAISISWMVSTSTLGTGTSL